MLCTLSLVLLASAPPAASSPPETPEGGPIEVLMLGNSFIGFNDQAELLNNLAAAGGQPASFSRFTPGGASLGGDADADPPHDSNPGSINAINSNDWDFVILQEHSCIPILPLAKENFMRTGAATLDARIKLNDPTTKTVFYQTWARQTGASCCYDVECTPTFPNFGVMQDLITPAIAEIACGLGAGVTPVGEAWRAALQAGVPTTLFDPDGEHPSYAGSYLSACVVYATVLGQSPVGNPFSGALSAPQAAFFQQIAHDTVLGPNAYVLDCTGPVVYCTGKASSAGCTAYIGATDIMTHPISGGLDYAITATNVQGFKNGLLIASPFGSAALPFNGGVFCVQPPTRRAGIQSSSGSFFQCNGSFSQIVNDGVALPFGLDAGPGNTAWYQYWYRDPQNGPGQLGTALTNGIAVDFL